MLGAERGASNLSSLSSVQIQLGTHAQTHVRQPSRQLHCFGRIESGHGCYGSVSACTHGVGAEDSTEK